MKISISQGNTKMGKVPSISLPPIKSCGNCKSCAKHCYAMKAYRMYEATRNAYDRNYELATEDGGEYFKQIDEYLKKNKPKVFRWHVAGDILSPIYFCGIVKVVVNNPSTTFLIFTKMYNIVNEFYSYFKIPKNLKVFFSVWLNEEIDNPYGFSTARTVAKGETSLHDGFICEGNCEACMACFEAKHGSKVIFEMH